MMRLKFWHKESGIAEKVKESNLNPEVKELFLGRNTVFSLMGFIVGGVMVGSTLWVISVEYLGYAVTLAIGILLFIASGILSRAFRK